MSFFVMLMMVEKWLLISIVSVKTNPYLCKSNKNNGYNKQE
jgi:hypothetical protein